LLKSQDSQDIDNSRKSLLSIEENLERDKMRSDLDDLRPDEKTALNPE